ncbi:MAG: polymer-forming cytoskeletal protein [Candidatus Doudnabacteria bacterium]|nr:polymer-forming cytoskeletal protein [Candidatus Doudnabacteria bacterium]
MKKLKLISLTVLVGLIFSGSAFAAEFIKPSDESGSVTLPSSETHHNLYAAGGNVIVNSRVTGDLYAAGGMVDVVGDVEDDLTVAGGNLSVSGKVGGNIRIAGGNINLRNTVGQDILAAGGNLYISEGAVINGDLVVAGGNIEVQGPINGKIKINGGKININSTVNGEVWLTATDSLTFGPKAHVNGKITYYGNSDPKIMGGAVVGTIDRHELPRKGPFSKSLLGFGFIISILGWLAAGLLLMYLFKRELHTTTDMMREEPWANLGIGLICLILTPIIFVLLLVSLIGYYIAFILIVLYILALMLSCLVGAIFLGRWILGYLDKEKGSNIDWRTVVVGVLAFEVLSWIPVIGWIAIFLLSITAFGTILRMVKSQLRRQ